MSGIDYTILAAYLVFLMAMGPVFKSFSRNASDYFRAGGTMIWWVAGSAVIMGGFSAWSFTGGAARAYETGFFFLILFVSNFFATCLQYFIAPKFRQMRVVTPVEAIRKRFGPVNEQFFTWIPVPISIFYAGIGLYTLSIFVSGAFGLPMTLLIVVLGVAVVVMTVVGGAWAVNASQFVQAMIFLAVTCVMVYTTLTHPQVGGLGGLLSQLPAQHWNWREFARPSIIAVFIGTLLLNQIVQMNAINAGAAKFITVKDGRDARRVVLMSLVAMVVMTPMWMIPPLGSTIVHPNLAAAYPTLNNPNEAAYVAMAQTTLPPGLLGLLICAIFSASLDNLSGGVNGAAAVLVRNFYIRLVNPHASDRRQILVGRALSVVCGALMITIALVFSRFKSLTLFDLILLLAASIGLPQAVPLLLGLFIRRAPPWSVWSTVIVGFATSLMLRLVLTAEFLQWLWRSPAALGAREVTDLRVAVTTGVLLVVCIGWFLLCCLIAPQRAGEARRRADAFFEEMNTPIDPRTEHGGAHESDDKQYRVLAMLCLISGGFITILAALPNSANGRLGLAFCGGSIAVVGGALHVVARRGERRLARAATPAAGAALIADATAGTGVV